MSEYRPTVAIAGSTGNLGQHITRACLSSTFFSRFKSVTALARDTDSPVSRSFSFRGAEVRELNLSDDDSIDRALTGVDVLVNALGGGDEGNVAKAKLLEGAKRNERLRVYFSGEFGIDHRLNDFPHKEWESKKAHIKKAREYGLKAVAVYVGLFTEDSFGPWFGLDTKHYHWSLVSPSPATSTSPPATFTSKPDVGLALASLALVPPTSLPDDVRISGDSVPLIEAKKGFEREAGDGKSIEIEWVDLDGFKKAVLEGEEGKKGLPPDFLRFIIAEGKLDHSKDNQNELVNPGESLWKWKTVDQYAKEVKGRPWCD